MAMVDGCHVGRSSAGTPSVDGQSQLNRSSTDPMQETSSQAAPEGTEELKEAAEKTLNVILDLDLDGVIRWVSPSWTDVIGIHPNDVHGRPIADFLLSNKTAFAEAVESLNQDDSRSQRIRFTIQMGPLSKLSPKSSSVTSAAREENAMEDDADATEEERKLELEGQGILVYDRTSGGKPHTMWMIRPWVPPRPIKIDLPSVLTDSLGVGAEMLAQTLMSITAADESDPQTAAPLPLLCRICERHIQPWWFEKHTELCMQEHRAELEAELAHEALVEQRAAIVRVLDALEARSSRHNGELTAPSLPPAEYKGMPIGPLSSPSSGLSSGTNSPASSRSRSREPSVIPPGHHRSRSFAVRRPMARIVELVLDLCDTAIEISISPTKESAMEGEGLSGWAASESRISQVLQWQSPGTNTLEQERGLAALCADTENAARAKVNAVLRHRRIVEYGERIRLELSAIVQDCMDTAARKAARLAAGDSGDSTDDEQVMIPCDDDMMDLDTYSAAPDGLRSASDLYLNMIVERRPSVQMSTGSNSPRGCPTPRSHRGAMASIGQNFSSKRSSTFFESDVGDSDSSVRSSVPSSFKRTESPASEYPLSRTSSRRTRKRHSMMLPEAMALPYRQSSPGKDIPPPSPVRLNKLRISGASDLAPSPISSPLLSTGELQSPALLVGAYSQHTAPNHSYQYQQQHLHHHRRQSSATSTDVLRPPVSPRLIAVGQTQTRAAPPSIKDFEIIKPISKGAFGSVYLSKKKTTGDYFAIKVLKKADMVAKNQVTNVKAERAIMMRQGESDYVAKLYWTFSSKDYLYLVMEYLNGGDCAALIKALGGLPEDRAKRYIAEVVLCVDDLHNRGIVHRDLKPDNLLIDQRGHLKLTDFGLSRMGLVGRQKRVLNSRENESVPDLLRQGPFSNSISVASSRSASFDLHGNHSTISTPQIASDAAAHLSQPSYFNLSRENSCYRDQSRRTSGYRSDSGGSETLQAMFSNFSLNDSPQFTISPRVALPGTDAHSAGSGSPDLFPPAPPSLESQTSAGVPHGISPRASLMPQPMALFDPEDTGRRFVGTPDYLAPETINGVGQDEMSDWWSLGCILFEFLYGYPPFHDESPDKVFDNILQHKISWPEEEDAPVSPEAKDLMNRLLCLDPRQRLGSNAEDKYASGGDEIRSHPWFKDIKWDTLYQEEAEFIPAPEHPEDTEYFDARGATLQAFTEEMEDQASSAANTPGAEIQDRPHDALSKVRSHTTSMKRGLLPLHIPPHVRGGGRTRRLSEPVPTDDFGAFTFKNLPVLERANKDVLQKLRAGQGTRNTSTGGGSLPGHSSAPSLDSSPVVQLPPRLFASNAKNPNRPPSPLGSDLAAASPTRASQPTSPLLLSFAAGKTTAGKTVIPPGACSSFL